MESDEFDLRNLREWQPIKDVFQKIPPKIQKGFFFQELNITCIDALPEFLALGSDIGIIFWYNRRNGNVQKLRTESTAAITCIRLVSSVEYMVAAGNTNGEVSIFQIQKELPAELLAAHELAATALITSNPIERYTIKDAYRGAITCVEWSKNGMKLFSGDNHGVVVLTSIDFGQHISKSIKVINENFGIVQMQFHNPWLLISTLYRAIICKFDETGHWKISQIGRTDRKVLNDFGAVFTPTDVDQRKPPSIICARPGFRFWMADIDGNVSHTFLLKESVHEVRSIFEVPLLNPVHNIPGTTIKDTYFGPCFYYLGQYIVTYCETMVFIVNLEKLKVMATIKRLRNIQYLTVNGNEIFIVEGGRSIVRISIVPEGAAMANSTKYVPSNNENLMLNDSNIEIQEETITQADECFELPPIENIQLDVPLACRIGEHQMLKEDKLLLEHSKKLEIFEKINTLDYDESILFQKGTKKKKKVSSDSITNDETKKVDGVVEIGRKAEFFNDNPNGFAHTNKEIVDQQTRIGTFANKTTKPCLMQASFCDFVHTERDLITPNNESEPKPNTNTNGTTEQKNNSIIQQNGNEAMHQMESVNSLQKDKSYSSQNNSPERMQFKPLELGRSYASSSSFGRQKAMNTPLFTVPALKLMYPIGNQFSRPTLEEFQKGERIIDGISMDSPLSDVPLTSDDDEYEGDAIDSLDIIKQCANNRTPTNTPPTMMPAPSKSHQTATKTTDKYFSSLANLPKLWDLKIEKYDVNRYNGDVTNKSNDNRKPEA
ncbi:WD repeat-containing protein CG11141 isoform X2 [Contarinia nasturtii]|uniref:WD repeat-containing protein CG11141 isoform X2 n=1 Tax=Contarinia nasturtii TaxID=265458 RepID=UPI0012D3C054|nr:WD repeat-containing protein CG11141 isoform X2 [Contarinia nasturtii]